jgi:hypothetical protein
VSAHTRGVRAGFVATFIATGAACVPTVGPSNYVAGAYYLVVEVDRQGNSGLRARAVGRDRDVRVFAASADLYYLGYSAPFDELGIDVRPDGSVGLARAGAASNDSFPLPPATHWSKVSAACEDGMDTCEMTGSAGLPPELMGVRVLRSSCPDIVLEPIAFPGGQGIVSAVAFGDDGGALLGRNYECLSKDRAGMCISSRPPSIVHVDPLTAPTTGRIVADGPASPTDPTINPLFYEEAGQLRVVWGSPVITYTFDVRDDLTFGAPEPIRALDGEVLYPIAIASRTFARGPTTLMVDYRRRLWGRESATGPFALLGAAETSTTVEIECDSGTDSSILAVTGERRGLVSFRRDPIRQVDLGAPAAIGAVYGPGRDAEACRSARTVMDSGDELLTWRGVQRLLDVRAELWWRAPDAQGRERADDEGWVRLDAGGLEPVGSGIAAYGDLVYVAVQSTGSRVSSIAVFLRDPTRPELPPRHCGNFETPMVIRVMESTSYGAVVAGLNAPPVWVRAVPRRVR